MPRIEYYWWKKCSTCRDAKKELEAKGVETVDRDFFAQPFTEAELRAIVGERPVRDVFSWNSPSFKKTGLAPDSLSDDALIAMMIEEPRLIRRPLAVVDGKLRVGAREIVPEK